MNKVAKKTPKKRIKNEEPIQPIPELSIKELNEQIDVYWKAIGNSDTYSIYKENWDNYDKFTALKNKQLKK